MQKGLTLNPTPRQVAESSTSTNHFTCDGALHFANDKRFLNSPLFQLHASASRYDVDKLITELEESSASTRLILIRVAMDNTTCTVSSTPLVRSYHPGRE